MFAALTPDYFGENYNATNYGLVYSGKLISGLFGGGLGAMVVGAWGYDGAYALAGGISMVAAVICSGCSGSRAVRRSAASRPTRSPSAARWSERAESGLPTRRRAVPSRHRPPPRVRGAPAQGHSRVPRRKRPDRRAPAEDPARAVVLDDPVVLAVGGDDGEEGGAAGSARPHPESAATSPAALSSSRARGTNAACARCARA